MRKSTYLVVTSLYLAGGCTPMSIDEFANNEPSFVPEDFFEGDTRAWGFFEDRMGNIRRQFVVDIIGQWNGKVLILTESFLYRDGETESRQWTITKIGPNKYTGTTSQSIGTAIGTTAGNAFHMKYDFNLNVGDSTWKVHFDDWMFLQPDGIVLNKATVSRWGLKIGTVFLSIKKRSIGDERRRAAAKFPAVVKLAGAGTR